MVKKICYIILISLLIISLTSCGLYKNHLEDFFSSWVPIENARVAIINNNERTITINNNVINTDDLVTKYGIQPSVSNPCYLLYSDNKLYATYSKSIFNSESLYQVYVEIFSVDLNTRELTVLHKGEYSPRDNPDSSTYSIFSYYVNRNIIFTDWTQTVVYNIDNDTIDILPKSAFSEFEESGKYKVDYLGGYEEKRIKIVSDTEERIITPEYMAERNEYAARLLTLENKRTIFGTIDPLKRFFLADDVFGEDIYLMCDVLDKDGERNRIVFYYDFVNDDFEFVYHSFDSDNPFIYLLPIE